MWEERRGKNKDKWAKNKEGCLGLSQDSLAFQPAHPWRSLPWELFSLDELLQVRAWVVIHARDLDGYGLSCLAWHLQAKLGDGLHNIAENRGPPQKMGMTEVFTGCPATLMSQRLHATPPRELQLLILCDHGRLLSTGRGDTLQLSCKDVPKKHGDLAMNLQRENGVLLSFWNSSSRWCSHLRSG